MKLPQLAHSEKRTVAIAGVTVVLTLAWVFGVKPFRVRLAAAREAIATERLLLAKERTAIASATNNPRLIHAVDSAMDALDPRLFTGRDETAAAAELSTYVVAMARASKVLIQNANTEKTLVARSGVRTLRARIRAESDLRGILSLLEALEHGDRMVTIENLDIQRPAAEDQQASEIEILNLTLMVRGYLVADPPPPEKGRGGGAPTARTLQGRSGQ